MAAYGKVLEEIFKDRCESKSLCSTGIQHLVFYNICIKFPAHLNGMLQKYFGLPAAIKKAEEILSVTSLGSGSGKSGLDFEYMVVIRDS